MWTSGFCDVRRPLATTFDKLRGTSPSSFFASALPEASRRLRIPSSGAEPQRTLRCFIIFEEPSGCCFVIFAEASSYPWGTFGNLRYSFVSRHLRGKAIPNSSSSRARSDSGRPNPRKNKDWSRQLCESISSEGRRWVRPKGMLFTRVEV